jgi:hypothetical protein
MVYGCVTETSGARVCAPLVTVPVFSEPAGGEAIGRGCSIPPAFCRFRPSLSASGSIVRFMHDEALAHPEGSKVRATRQRICARATVTFVVPAYHSSSQLFSPSSPRKREPRAGPPLSRG